MHTEHAPKCVYTHTLHMPSAHMCMVTLEVSVVKCLEGRGISPSLLPSNSAGLYPPLPCVCAQLLASWEVCLALEGRGCVSFSTLV